MVDQKKIEMEADFLAVLAQPTRLKILYFLKEGERCACEINPMMTEDPSVVSRHLVKMKETGLLGFRKEGVSKYYWIKETRLFGILNLVDEIIRDGLKEKVELTDSIL